MSLLLDHTHCDGYVHVVGKADFDLPVAAVLIKGFGCSMEFDMWSAQVVFHDFDFFDPDTLAAETGAESLAYRLFRGIARCQRIISQCAVRLCAAADFLRRPDFCQISR